MTMSTYRVLVKGTGLMRVIEGIECPVGVFGTVFVTGSDEHEARAIAVEELRANLASKQAITERTRFQVEEAQPIRADEVPEVRPGLAFYRE
jgi:hypothetical protein